MTTHYPEPDTHERLTNQEFSADAEEVEADIVNDDDDNEQVTQEVRPPVIVTAPPKSDQEPKRDTSYLSDQDSVQADERWHRIQAEFVDDPRKSVAEAHALVGELTQRIVDAFAKERRDLERQWSEGDSVSTEELRVCLQRYRKFFSRLLPSANGFESAR